MAADVSASIHAFFAAFSSSSVGVLADSSCTTFGVPLHIVSKHIMHVRPLAIVRDMIEAASKNKIHPFKHIGAITAQNDFRKIPFVVRLIQKNIAINCIFHGVTLPEKIRRILHQGNYL